MLPTSWVRAQTPEIEALFDGMIEAENAGYGGVENLLLETETMGMTTMEYYEKTSELTLDNGEKVYVMRRVPMTEVQERQSSNSPFAQASPDQLKGAADVVEDAGRQMEAGLQQEFMNSGIGGLGGGLLFDKLMNPPTDQPWLSPSPRTMTRMYAEMLRATATEKEQRAAEDPKADTQRRIADLRQVMAGTEIAGREMINGRDAIGMVTTGLNQTQTADGQEFTLNTVALWVDAEKHVPLRLKMEGVMRANGESRPISIERDDMDYRTVPGCGEIYKPARSIMRIAGIMTPAQQAEMSAAQAKLADFDKQMAQMPESQRAMIMRQMGPQMDMMKKMSSGGGVEVESKVVNMRCNAGAPGAMEVAMATFGGGAAGLGAGAAPRPQTQPYYVDGKGVGVIRHSGSAGEYFLTVKRTTGDVLAGPMGPYEGPDVGIYIGSLNMMGVPLAELELELHQENPSRTAVRFRPEINAKMAESLADCGTPSPIGACSN
jgi:hypothetical protein